MKRTAGTIIMVIVPLLLALSFVGYLVTGEGSGFMPSWTDLLKTFDRFPTWSEWIGTANDDFIASCSALSQAVSDIKDFGSFTVACWKLIIMAPIAVGTFVRYLVYPFVCLAYAFWFIMKIIYRIY